jgi:lipopolysaccharide/colanic/teichoic acid biosynthesis glycosyltransferase
MKSNYHFHGSLLWFIDWFLLNLSLFIVLFSYPLDVQINNKGDFIFFVFLNFLWVISIFLNGLYKTSNWFDFKGFWKATIQSLLLFYCLVGILYFTKPLYFYSHIIIWTFLVFAILIITQRIFFQILLKWVGKIWQKRIVVIGNNELASKLATYIKSEPYLFDLSATFSKVIPDSQDPPSQESTILEKVDFSESFPNHVLLNKELFGKAETVANGISPSYSFTPAALDIPMKKTINKHRIYEADEVSISACMDYIEHNEVTELYCTLSPETYPYLYQLAKQAEEHFVIFKFVADFNQLVNNGKWVEQFKDLPMLSLRPHPLGLVSNSIQKRIFDIVFSTLVIVGILSWLTPILAIFIAMESRGPIFFIQLRSGKNNKPFWCFKFRTLRLNIDSDKIQVTKNDARITKIGKILRKSNIDELPQFINVFLGDMSVVGPRPHMLKHTEEFNDLEEDYMVRHFVKPGITGLAQVNGFRGEIRHPDLLKKRLEKDIAYIEHWSMVTDLKIILKTIYVSMKGDKNAY